MSNLGQQPTAAGGGCGKAKGPPFDKLPANRRQIKDRIFKEVLLGDGKQATGGGGGGGGGGYKLPATRGQIKKQIVKQLFSTTTNV